MEGDKLTSGIRHAKEIERAEVFASERATLLHSLWTFLVDTLWEQWLADTEVLLASTFDLLRLRHLQKHQQDMGEFVERTQMCDGNIYTAEDTS